MNIREFESELQEFGFTAVKNKTKDSVVVRRNISSGAIALISLEDELSIDTNFTAFRALDLETKKRLTRLFTDFSVESKEDKLKEKNYTVKIHIGGGKFVSMVHTGNHAGNAFVFNETQLETLKRKNGLKECIVEEYEGTWL